MIDQDHEEEMFNNRIKTLLLRRSVLTNARHRAQREIAEIEDEIQAERDTWRREH